VPLPAPCQRLYGPDRLPLEESAVATAARWGYRPFHGIVSLGLREHPACTPDGWREAAPLLDTLPRAGGVLDDAARDCGVLSFDDSLAAAEHAASEYGNGSAVAELWNLKEGHTTSVWCATYECAADDNDPRRIVLNVARDDLASRELEQATATYSEMVERAPDIAAARVLAIWKLRRDGDGGEPVTVVAQKWIDDAYEINALPAGADSRGQLCAVERFITDPAQPARICSVRGGRLTAEEHGRVGACVALLLRQGASYDSDLGAWSLPRFVVNHGDWVWQHDRALAVACGAAAVIVYTDSLHEAVHGALRDICGGLDVEFARAVSDGAAAPL
jgi:hypothetical protein